MPDFKFERKLGGRVAGIDEAGRGPLAGPVVADAVVFSDTTMPNALAKHGSRQKNTPIGELRAI